MKRKILLSIAISLMLTGCQVKPGITPTYEALSSSQQTLANRIHRYGAFIHQQGTRLWVVIPTDTFFSPGSTELVYDRIAPIADIANLVQSYQKSHPGSRIRVMGFNNPKLTSPSARNSSIKYAKVITQYLKSFGVTKSIKTTLGKNKTSPTSLTGDSFSRRVIISVNV